MVLKFDDFLRNNPDLNQYIKVNNCKYEEGGVNTPIPNDFLKTLPNNEVIITFEVFEKLFNLARDTSETDCEHCFFLISPSEEVEGNKCRITNFIAYNSQLNHRTAIFDKDMIRVVEGLEEKVRNGKLKEGLTLFVGHTHPAIGSWYNNFSFGDLKGYARGAVYGYELYEKRLIETAGCMLTADGIMRMVFFDPDVKEFYKFTNIQVELQNGLLDFKECFDARLRDINKTNKNLEDYDDDHDSR